MIDLTGCKEVFEDYAGSERKTALIYNVDMKWEYYFN